MEMKRDNYHSLEVTLLGPNNKTLKGVFNFSAIDVSSLQEEEEEYDAHGAATFVIAVILVYGLSIVLLIFSLAKRNLKHKQEEQEDKQIHQYLNQAPVLREKGARENYKNLKKKVITLVSTKSGSGNVSSTSSCSPGTQLQMGLRSVHGLMAVGSPLAATISGDEPSRNPFFSDADSTKALLESSERLNDEVFDSSHNSRQLGGYFRTDSYPVFSRQSDLSEGDSSPASIRDGRYARRSYGHVPRVVVTESRHYGRNAPKVDKPEAPRIKPSEDDSKIIYDTDNGSYDNNNCRLSMDDEGNIWILHSNPDEFEDSGRDNVDSRTQADPVTRQAPVVDPGLRQPDVAKQPQVDDMGLVWSPDTRSGVGGAPTAPPVGGAPNAPPAQQAPSGHCTGICHPGHHLIIGQLARSKRSPSPNRLLPTTPIHLPRTSHSRDRSGSADRKKSPDRFTQPTYPGMVPQGSAARFATVLPPPPPPLNPGPGPHNPGSGGLGARAGSTSPCDSSEETVQITTV